MEESVSTTIRRFWAELLPAGERVKFSLVLVMALAAAVTEMLGVASIGPFMAAVLNESLIDRTPYLAQLLQTLGAKTSREKLAAMGFVTLAAIILGNLANATSFYSQQWFSSRCRALWSSELFARYMRSSYAFHIRRDAPSLQKVLITDVDAAAFAVNQVLQLISRTFVIVALLGLVIVRSPLVAFGAAIVLGGGYWLIDRLVSQRQKELGHAVSAAQTLRARAAQEGLGGIKELIVLERLEQVVSSYRQSITVVANGTASNQLTANIPRYVLESVAYGGLIAVTLILISNGGGASSAFPTLTLLAFAAYRLMPALQQVFSAAVTLRFSSASVKALLDDWAELGRGGVSPTSTTNSHELDLDELATSQRVTQPPLINIRDVTLTYPGALRPALVNVSVTIQPGQSVGLVGRTGAGKTTLADLLLGLYTPDSGVVSVDGRPLDKERMREFRRKVGYVPQQVFLANASVAENIAFGIPSSLIKRHAVEAASLLAQADDFVRQLPDGYDTIVGERGVKLSGGQRQRLGIARALYHRPSVLVFDEATSALDGMTEESVMDAIRRLAGERTVILVAHRLRTVEACDQIVMLDGGHVVANGTYKELESGSPAFRRLTGHEGEAQRTSVGQ